MRHRVARTFWLTLLVAALLGATRLLPPLAMGEHPLRRVDLLADVRPDMPPPLPADSVAPDTLPLPPAPKPPFADTCRTGMTCIEDYAGADRRGMAPFYEALAETERTGRPVRIAYFGDSFIEGDILTADLRSLLQSRFGGCGVGYVDIALREAGFRPTVRMKSEGWEVHTATDTSRFDPARQGIDSRYFTAREGAFTEARGQRRYGEHLDAWEVSTLYFESDGEGLIRVVTDGRDTLDYPVGAATALQQIERRVHTGRIRWSIVAKPDTATFFGIALDGEQGISLDNLSLRSSSGLGLRSLPLARMRRFGELRPYDLIVLQYGLNVATPQGKDYDYYERGLLPAIERLKECFPEAGLLLVGVGDRAFRDEEGRLQTMPGILRLIRYQQHIAARSGIAFWNLYEAMGGEGSMERMTQATPPEANLDYTHINFRGGRRIARLFYEALLYGKEQHERRKAYEAE